MPKVYPSSDIPPTKSFLGLNNVGDPQRLGLNWLVIADNVDITDRNAIVRARGFTQATTNFAITGAYATKDNKRLYVVDAGELRQMSADLSSYVVLRTGLSPQKVNFEEVNGAVFFSNGIDFGIIDPQVGYRPWGLAAPIPPKAVATAGGGLAAGVYQVVCTYTDEFGLESSNSIPVAVTVAGGNRISITEIPQAAGCITNIYITEPNGTIFFFVKERTSSSATFDVGMAKYEELPFQNLDVPRGVLPAYFQGCMYLAEDFYPLEQSVIWCSLPLHYHHFNYSGAGIGVPGHVRMLKGLAEHLIIGTDRQIFAYDGAKLTELAPYGVTPGWHASELKEALYFWSLRGLCRAMPFTNLTESTVSVPPGLSAGATVMEKDGMRRYVVALHSGGDAYNRRDS
jgi:hypothetical protein